MNSVLKMASPLQLQACQQLKQLISTTTSRTNFSGVHNGLKIFPDTSSKGLHILSYNCCRYFTQYLHTGKRHVGRFVGMNSKVQNRFLIPYRTLSQRTSSRGSTGVPTSTVLYIGAAGIFMLGLGYAGVPLYRMFCQATGYGGSVMVTPGHDASKVEGMQPVQTRRITVKFNADTASSMQWKFRPQQPKVDLVPGETALAFYTAKNPTDKPVVGISTYNVIPFEAGIYFNKIQCFCFEEQRLNPHEQVDMPVFFFIDPEFAEDPKMENVEEITLSYTFFEAKEGMSLPLPGYMQPIQSSQ